MQRIYLAAALILGLLLTAAVPVAGAQNVSKDRTPVELQFITVSDWHGQVDPVDGAGGAAVLSTYFKQERANNPNTLVFTAGDSIGATPPVVNFFDEEPSIRAMRLMGFDADTFGNHNFDKGVAHNKRMIELAAAPAGEVDGTPFPFVAANLTNVAANLGGSVEPFKIFELGGVKVAVIGIVNPEAPTLVFPGSFGTMEVTDPVAAVERAKGQARRAGAKVIVVLTHMGITGTDLAGTPTGPLTEFAQKLEGVHIVFGDHTDVEYKSVINDALVVENRSKGIRYARTTLTVDPQNGRVIDRDVQFVTPTAAAVTPDPAVVAMLAPYRTELAAIFDSYVALTTGVFVRGGNIERRQEVAIGNLVTDSMRWRYGSQIGFTNSGGLRDSIPSAHVVSNPAVPRTGCAPATPCHVVVGDAYAVLPFGNIVLTRMVSGAQLWAMLEHGVSTVSADGTNTNGRFPQVSGMRFTFDSRLAPGGRVTSVQLEDGTPIPNDLTQYSLVTNDFVNAGGDGYTMLRDGQGVTREVMADVFLEYMTFQGTLTPMTFGRITNLATAG